MNIKFSSKDNLIHNKEAFAKLENIRVGKSVFSADGYIEYQNGMQNVKYGAVTAAYGGCGAIAVWNIMKFFGKKRDKAEVFSELEKGLVLSGNLGTSVTFVKRYLASQGIRANVYMSLCNFKKAKVEQGILYYMRKNFTAHYVAFTPAGVNENGERIYRFHNDSSVSYWERDGHVRRLNSFPMTMDEFLHEANAVAKVFYDVQI